jgi:hypothetical protein
MSLYLINSDSEILLNMVTTTIIASYKAVHEFIRLEKCIPIPLVLKANVHKGYAAKFYGLKQLINLATFVSVRNSIRIMYNTFSQLNNGLT